MKPTQSHFLPFRFLDFVHSGSHVPLYSWTMGEIASPPAQDPIFPRLELASGHILVRFVSFKTLLQEMQSVWLVILSHIFQVKFQRFRDQ